MTNRSYRAQAVEAALGAIRSAGDDLEQIRRVLSDLASRAELFPYEQFALDDGSQEGVFRLSEGAVTGPALYVSVGRTGRRNLPHTHPTWSVVAAVRGAERNFVYDRVDNGRVEGRGILRLREEVEIGPGESIAFRPGEFHYLVVTSQVPSLQLHAYGIPLEAWTGALPVFPTPDSGVYELIPVPLPGLHIAEPRV